MLNKLKEIWNRFKVFIVLSIASLVFALLVIRKSVGGGLEEYLLGEAKAKDDAKKKLQEGQAKLDAEKKQRLDKVEEKKKKDLLAAEKEAENQKKALKNLEKKDSRAFKEKMEKQLGVKEKGKARSKKNG